MKPKSRSTNNSGFAMYNKPTGQPNEPTPQLNNNPSNTLNINMNIMNIGLTAPPGVNPLP